MSSNWERQNAGTGNWERTAKKATSPSPLLSIRKQIAHPFTQNSVSDCLVMHYSLSHTKDVVVAFQREISMKVRKKAYSTVIASLFFEGISARCWKRPLPHSVHCPHPLLKTRLALLFMWVCARASKPNREWPKATYFKNEWVGRTLLLAEEKWICLKTK